MTNNANSKLIEQLIQQIQSCERRSLEKDKEMEVLKQLNQKFQMQIHKLKNKVEDLTEKISLQSSVQAESRVNRHMKNCCLSRRLTSDPEVKKLIENYESEIFLLKKQAMNVHEYIPGKQTVFEWSLYYDYWKEIGGEKCSPKLYARPKGHYCMLSLHWEEEPFIGVHLHTCTRFTDDEIMANN